MGLIFGVDGIDGPGVALPGLADESVYGRQRPDHFESEGVREFDRGVRSPPFSEGQIAFLDPLLLLQSMIILLLGIVELLPNGAMASHSLSTPYVTL